MRNALAQNGSNGPFYPLENDGGGHCGEDGILLGGGDVGGKDRNGEAAIADAYGQFLATGAFPAGTIEAFDGDAINTIGSSGMRQEVRYADYCDLLDTLDNYHNLECPDCD